ncbi:MAG: helix-turn-helix domain-containing protein [Candidatus Subteraquimicrobiales bacterium]|nr:helix-turn-helix domain-containing protein [Candidatus Subteraquimicrobiales bacterium]
MISYREIMNSMPDSKSRISFRYRLVVYALEHGISACARKYNTTRRTVQLWVRRYDSQSGVESLKVKSRVGQNHPQKIPEETRQEIIAYRKKTKNQLGARPLVELLGLSCSAKTVNKIIKQHGLTQKRATKWKKRWDMSAVRAQYKPFRKIQIDAKYLNDIPECYPAYFRGDIPKYMFSARDYKTGWLFTSFSNRLDSVSTSIFARYLIDRLQKAGVDLSEVSFQTDNGKEFVDRLTNTTTPFQEALEGKVEHRIIPPASPRYNSDVETFHGRVESEFLKPEDFNSFPDFMTKAFLYNIYFNLFRKNRNRGNKTPNDLLKEESAHIHPYSLIIPPIICDAFRNDYYDNNYPVYLKGLPLSGRLN